MLVLAPKKKKSGAPRHNRCEDEVPATFVCVDPLQALKPEASFGVGLSATGAAAKSCQNHPGDHSLETMDFGSITSALGFGGSLSVYQYDRGGRIRDKLQYKHTPSLAVCGRVPMETNAGVWRSRPAQ